MSRKPDDKQSEPPTTVAINRLSKAKGSATNKNEPMVDEAIEGLISAFESAAHLDEDGVEYWFARELQGLFEYSKWENFEAAIKRAMIACQKSGQEVRNHWLPDVRKSISGKGKTEDVADFQMTRYACYLTAQNADASKKPVAFAQTYFAIQTRRQELSDQTVAGPESEDDKRVYLRNQIKEHNIKLSGAARDAGVSTPQEFAIFHSKGYQGLYGRTVPEIRQYKRLPTSVDILDRMGSTELAANFFRVTQTEEKLRKDGIRGLKKAYATHYAVGRQVREAMLKISGIAPEDLPVADSIKNAEKRVRAEQRSQPPQPTALSQRRQKESQTENAVEAGKLDEQNSVDLRRDLWKFALLIMAISLDGAISVDELVRELPKYIHHTDGAQDAGRKQNEPDFPRLVRNLKSQKASESNFIFQGYAEDIRGGFRITAKGRAFVKSYFAAE